MVNAFRYAANANGVVLHPVLSRRGATKGKSHSIILHLIVHIPTYMGQEKGNSHRVTLSVTLIEVCAVACLGLRCVLWLV